MCAASSNPSVKKIIAHCLYCQNPPDGEEHWLPRSLGAFEGNTMLKDRICRSCNERLGRVLDLELARSGPAGLTRQLLGIEGRRSHERKDVFDYQASRIDRPIKANLANFGPDRDVPMVSVGQNLDGTLRMI